MITENVLNDAVAALMKQLDHLVFRTGWRHWVATGPGMSHSHSGWELVYHPVNKGEIKLEDGGVINFESGDIVITPPGCRHSQKNTVAGQDFCLVFESEMPGGVLPSQMIHLHYAKPDEFVIGELTALTSGIGQNSETARKIMNYRVRALFAALLFSAEKEDSVRTAEAVTCDYVAAARRWLDEAYGDKDLEIRRVAKKIGVSGDYLRHLFQTALGISPKQYLLRRRIARVEDLLFHSTLSLKEIAELSGFANERYLCFYYRQVTGITPGAFRRQKNSHEL